jgi:hypothetical protein
LVLPEDLPQRPTGGVILIEGTVSQDFLKHVFSIMSRIILAIVEFFKTHTDDADFFNNTVGKQWLQISNRSQKWCR